MVWQDDSLQNLVQEAKELLRTLFSNDFTTEIYICSFDELQSAITTELKGTMPDREFSQIMRSLNYTDGRYFKKKNQIWLVNDRGVNVDTIIHELLHTIQICSPHREGIVYYITYKITHNDSHIKKFMLQDWIEIEKTYSFKLIIQQLFKNTDCENFQ